MNYEDEDYVRFYTRDTVSWMALGWEGQAVLALMLHGKFDRAGVFDCDGHTPSHAVTLVTRLPEDVAAIGLKRLFDSKTWIHRDGRIVWPKYVHAQSCRRSDRVRQRESRDKRRSDALGQPVTPGDEPSPPVTTGHRPSQPVTLSLAEPSRAEQRESSPAGENTESGSFPIHPPPPPALSGIDPRDTSTQRLFDSGTDDDRWSFQQWADGFGKSGAVFDARRAECLSERRREGMAREDVPFVIAGAQLDDFVMGRGRFAGKKNDRLSYIFGTRERVEEFAERGRAAATKASPAASQAAKQNFAELEARARRQNAVPARQPPISPPANANRGTRVTDPPPALPEAPAVSEAAS